MLTVEYIQSGKGCVPESIPDGEAEKLANSIVDQYLNDCERNYRAVSNELVLYFIRLRVYDFTIPMEQVKVIFNGVPLVWSKCGSFYNHPDSILDDCLMGIFIKRGEYNDKRKKILDN